MYMYSHVDPYDGDSDQEDKDEKENAFIASYVYYDSREIDELIRLFNNNYLLRLVKLQKYNMYPDTKLYHWSCLSNRHKILTDTEKRIGVLHVNKGRHGQGVSNNNTKNINEQAQDVFNEAKNYTDNWYYLSPEGKSEKQIKYLALYWYVNKNIASYFSPNNKSFMSIVESNCEEERHNTNIDLWKFIGNNIDNFLFLKDPESLREGVMIIPKKNSKIPVKLIKNPFKRSRETPSRSPPSKRYKIGGINITHRRSSKRKKKRKKKRNSRRRNKIKN